MIIGTVPKYSDIKYWLKSGTPNNLYIKPVGVTNAPNINKEGIVTKCII